ncbi:Na+/H+ antiporter subunit E [Streptomyces sp. 549]|uniref:Na+/H+ antiporter subunit E n=1 Tax=Streptomyces sp. 549 TaxID=3049076 RepID=UPI0024C4020D|nr:Na+/H+ antiporter subunit E [Streptomyces sp. 549]MDK1476592.1 Na+/H+ antiporter subunit E [Streptomyces sp. 549]
MSEWVRRATLRSLHVAAFLVGFGYRLVKANLTMAWEILTPPSGLSPAIVRVPLRCRTDFETVSLGNLINLTPGTLTLEVSTEPPVLYVHGAHAHDVEAFRQGLRELETLMLVAFRPADEAAELRRST